MIGRPNRVEPGMPATAMQTYRVSAPLATHFRRATCEEVRCAAYSHGWRTVLDDAGETGAAQARYIRERSGRRFAEARDELGRAVFTFAPGQTCFAADAHRAPLEREANYLVVPGDWRGTTGPVRRHSGPDPWLDDFQTNQERLLRLTE